MDKLGDTYKTGQTVNSLYIDTAANMTPDAAVIITADSVCIDAAVMLYQKTINSLINYTAVIITVKCLCNDVTIQLSV